MLSQVRSFSARVNAHRPFPPLFSFPEDLTSHLDDPGRTIHREISRTPLQRSSYECIKSGRSVLPRGPARPQFPPETRVFRSRTEFVGATWRRVAGEGPYRRVDKSPRLARGTETRQKYPFPACPGRTRAVAPRPRLSVAGSTVPSARRLRTRQPASRPLRDPSRRPNVPFTCAAVTRNKDTSPGRAGRPAPLYPVVTVRRPPAAPAALLPPRARARSSRLAAPSAVRRGRTRAPRERMSRRKSRGRGACGRGRIASGDEVSSGNHWNVISTRGLRLLWASSPAFPPFLPSVRRSFSGFPSVRARDLPDRTGSPPPLLLSELENC